MAGIKDYSTNPASNTALFPEGMAPSAVNDGMRQVQADLRQQWNDAEWFAYGDGDGTASIAYAGAASFTVAGDVTAEYHAGRRVKIAGSLTGTVYGRIVSSSYGAPNTTVTLALDAGALQNEALAVHLAIVRAVNGSLPAPAAATTTAPGAVELATVGEQLAGSDATRAATPDGVAGLWEKGPDIASASTLALPAAGGGYFDVTGTTAVTAIGSEPAGRHIRLQFDGALTLTHGAASLVLQGGVNRTTAAGDVAEFVSEGAGKWRQTNYWPATPAAVPAASEVAVQVFTANGTYSKPADLLFAKVMVVGGGGGGGSSGAADRGGGGGGGGGYSEEWLMVSAIGASETVTVGGGGSAGSSGNGGTGGTSSFGALLSATGGSGGTQSSSSAVNGGSGGVGSGGAFNVKGGGGGPGIPVSGGAGGSGGSSVLGGGARGRGGGTSGEAGGSFGGGGGGGVGNNNGGAGADGIVVVVEYKS